MRYKPPAETKIMEIIKNAKVWLVAKATVNP